MKRIDKLTEEQEALFPEFIDRWRKICLSTEDANWKDFEEGVKECYVLSRLALPKFIIKAASPWALVQALPYSRAWAAYIKHAQVSDQVREQVSAQVSDQVREQVSAQVYDQVREQVSAQVSDQVYDQVSVQVYAQVDAQVREQVSAQVDAQVRAQVYDQVYAQVRAQVNAQVYAQVSDQVREQVRAQVSDQVYDQVSVQVYAQVDAQVREQVSAQVNAQVYAQVSDQVYAQVDAQVREQVSAQVSDQVYAQVDAQVREQVSAQVSDQVREQKKQKYDNWYKYLGGGYWSGWQAYIDYFISLGLELPEDKAKKQQAYRKAQANGNWWYPQTDFAILVNRPSEIHRDNRNRLHHESKMAIRYRDGWGFYCWHGIRVPAWIITNPETITTTSIDKEANQEIKRVMIERFGLHKYVQSGSKIHQDDFGTLYQKPIEGTDIKLTMVHVVNGSRESDGTYKDYFLEVHPELKPLYEDGTEGEAQSLTAKNAVASTYGMRGEEYLVTVRT